MIFHPDLKKICIVKGALGFVVISCVQLSIMQPKQLKPLLVLPWSSLFSSY